MFILDSLLVGGLRFVLDKVALAVDQEANDQSAIRESLLEAQMQLELGELTDAEFAAIERDLLGRLRKARGQDRSLDLRTRRVKVTGVEASTTDGRDRS
jgi:gas vesicle protein GvpG